jgi:hypothetical protein
LFHYLDSAIGKSGPARFRSAHNFLIATPTAARIPMARDLRISAPGQVIVLKDVPANATAFSLSRVLAHAALAGRPAGQFVLVKSGGRLLNWNEPVDDGITLEYGRDPYRRARTCTASIFLLLHAIPVLLWFCGSPPSHFIPVYFLCVFIISMIARTFPVLSVSLPVDNDAPLWRRLVLAFVLSLWPLEGGKKTPDGWTFSNPLEPDPPGEPVE